jgi:hypothetical protein
VHLGHAAGAERLGAGRSALEAGADGSAPAEARSKRALTVRASCRSALEAGADGSRVVPSGTDGVSLQEIAHWRFACRAEPHRWCGPAWSAH